MWAQSCVAIAYPSGDLHALDAPVHRPPQRRRGRRPHRRLPRPCRPVGGPLAHRRGRGLSRFRPRLPAGRGRAARRRDVARPARPAHGARSRFAAGRGRRLRGAVDRLRPDPRGARAGAGPARIRGAAPERPARLGRRREDPHRRPGRPPGHGAALRRRRPRQARRLRRRPRHRQMVRGVRRGRSRTRQGGRGHPPRQRRTRADRGADPCARGLQPRPFGRAAGARPDRRSGNRRARQSQAHRHLSGARRVLAARLRRAAGDRQGREGPAGAGAARHGSPAHRGGLDRRPDRRLDRPARPRREGARGLYRAPGLRRGAGHGARAPADVGADGRRFPSARHVRPRACPHERRGRAGGCPRGRRLRSRVPHPRPHRRAGRRQRALAAHRLARVERRSVGPRRARLRADRLSRSRFRQRGERRRSCPGKSRSTATGCSWAAGASPWSRPAPPRASALAPTSA